MDTNSDICIESPPTCIWAYNVLIQRCVVDSKLYEQKNNFAPQIAIWSLQKTSGKL